MFATLAFAAAFLAFSGFLLAQRLLRAKLLPSLRRER
jgi:hypothetical protein